MVELVANGPDGAPRWRRPLPPHPVTLGRLSPKSDWDCPWDDSISRLHATLTWQQDRLLVRRDPNSRNQVFFQGQPLDEFTVTVGDTFVIGQTRFTLEGSVPTPVSADPTPQAELTCTRQQLRDLKYAIQAERGDARAGPRAWAEQFRALLQQAIHTRHQEQAGELDAAAFAALPENLKQRYFRGDSACHENQLLNWEK